jgi:hypothetical protein
LLEWKAVIENIAWYKAGVSPARGHIRVLHGFSFNPSLTDKIPQVNLSNCSTNISGLAISKFGSLVSIAGGFEVSEGALPSKNPTSHGSIHSSEWRAISSISSLSSSRSAEKLKSPGRRVVFCEASPSGRRTGLVWISTGEGTISESRGDSSSDELFVKNGVKSSSSALLKSRK